MNAKQALSFRTALFVSTVILLAAFDPRKGLEAAASPSPAALPTQRTTSQQSQTEIAAKFDAAKTTLLEASKPADFSKFQALHGATLLPAPTGLRVTSTGTDPQILLPPFADGKKFIAKVVVEAPFDTPMQMFYQLRERPGFVEAQSQLVPLKKGRNAVYQDG